jgi:hypothetical protein
VSDQTEAPSPEDRLRPARPSERPGQAPEPETTDPTGEQAPLSGDVFDQTFLVEASQDGDEPVTGLPAHEDDDTQIVSFAPDPAYEELAQPAPDGPLLDTTAALVALGPVAGEPATPAEFAALPPPPIPLAGPPPLAGIALAWFDRLPLPAVAAAGVAVLTLTVGGLVAVTTGGDDPQPGGPADAIAAVATTAPPATAPPPALAKPAPRNPEVENAGRREAFLVSMQRVGLNPEQSGCVADKVEVTIGWDKLGESLMDPGKPQQLQELIMACMRG